MAMDCPPADAWCGEGEPPARVFAGIPAKDEADELGGCLAALGAQDAAILDGVVLCLNNCSDGSAAVARQMAAKLPFPVHVLDVTLPPSQASAGVARRLAMDRAAVLAGPGGVVLTTDADSRVAPDWLAVNLHALRAGADAVAGRAEIEPEGAALIPPHLHAIDARECRYAALLDEIASLIDPDPYDPWPRHDEHSGASIAVTVEAYRHCGGMPPIGLAEDRAFFDALRRVDARIRHAPGARVVVSARLEGRARGGMADTMRRRLDAVDPFLDDRLESVAAAIRRARARAALRAAWHAARSAGGAADGRDAPAHLKRLSRLLGVDVAAALDGRCFGAVWSEVEAASPVLRRARVALADLARHTARAVRVRDGLRAGRFAGALTAAGGPGGIDLAEAAD